RVRTGVHLSQLFSELLHRHVAPRLIGEQGVAFFRIAPDESFLRKLYSPFRGEIAIMVEFFCATKESRQYDYPGDGVSHEISFAIQVKVRSHGLGLYRYASGANSSGFG